MTENLEKKSLSSEPSNEKKFLSYRQPYLFPNYVIQEMANRTYCSEFAERRAGEMELF